MHAVILREHGGPDVLELREIPSPEPGPGQIRVRVVYTALNRADLLQRAGFYPAPPGSPRDILGLEYAGYVDALGPGVLRWKEGDPVMGLVGGGSYAEALVVHEREAVAIPAGLSLRDAAAIPEAFVTAYDALVVRGRLGPGDTALIHAAASGVGTAAVQIAAALGARVIGTTRTEGKRRSLEHLGPHTWMVLSASRFADEVRQATGGRGVDVVLELVGGAYVPESLASCAHRGRLVLVGLTGGASASLDLSLVLRQRLEIHGTVLRSRPLEEKIEAASLLERRILPLLTLGRLAPVIDREFPLHQASEAHRYLATNTSVGKVLLKI
ncbi:MAG: NAD(P)H-quinone oxidoreductase [Myxococcales bacterium]|nr:NAD(P)H-quinone oxidoreductase [Polyangiaceae bacterium]MDW8248243.1 NAD(P)H-quinone oxidoreductase [Myxococcales bacterium]